MTFRMLKPLLLFMFTASLVMLACNLPLYNEPSPVPGATMPPFPVETEQPLPGPTTPVGENPAEPVSEISFFLVALEDAGQSGIPTGCNDSLVMVQQPVEPTSDPIRVSLERLFSFREQFIGESGLYTALWQSNLQIQSVSVEGGTATVELTGDYQLSGACDTPRFIGQIEQTILSAPAVENADIFLNGQPIEQVLSSQ